jgi:alkylation response protein AidB-like acyl-CoA dehydrogenase
MHHLARLEEIGNTILAPLAQRTDKEGRFPREVIKALGEAGLLGLTLPTRLRGMGLGLREATEVVSRIAQTCPSTAMVVCMH